MEKLSEMFKEFPGIGPRQAKRFVYFLRSRGKNFVSELVREIDKLHDTVCVCKSCFKLFPKNNFGSAVCSICSDQSRDATTLLIVSRDSDLDAIERSDSYRGLYFVLGGSVPILEEKPETKIRLNELKKIISERISSGALKEIIFALSANPEGENTEMRIREVIEPIVAEKSVKISRFGRGLSTGTELEYSDPDTISNAFNNRQ